MSTRDVAVAALGRFLTVERYRETCLPSSASRLPDPGAAGGGRRRVRPRTPAHPAPPVRLPASSQAKTPADRGERWPLAPTTRRHPGAKLGDERPHGRLEGGLR